MKAVVVALVIVVGVMPARAQAPCDACTRGNALIDRYSLQPIRTFAGEIAELSFTEPLTLEQYAKIVELRRRDPALTRVGALDDADLALVAAALCEQSNTTCPIVTTQALRCLADRCAVGFPDSGPTRVDIVARPADCDPYTERRRRSPAFGVGFDWGTGIQRSRYLNDGAAWSFGIETRLRLGQRHGVVARVDRVAGRDAAEDLDDNGRDDVATGSIVRIMALGGPSIVLSSHGFEGTNRFLRLDLLGGYMGTRSQPDEHGPVAGFDLAYQLSIIRAGIRVVQGFGGASDSTMVLGHLGFIGGSRPQKRNEAGCIAEPKESPTRLALGFDIPIGGYGFSSDLGYLPTGLAFEAVWHLTRRFDAVTRADVLLFSGYERDRALHHAALAGLRMDHGKAKGRRSSTGWFTTALAGYSHAAGVTPSDVVSGPVIDLGVGVGGQGTEGAANLRLHGRFGVSPDNESYRVLFLSVGMELRLDPRRWRDRFP